jgi:predicted site-specific integrase-resolvase
MEALRVSRGSCNASAGYVTLVEADWRLGIANATVQRLAQDGRLPTYRDQRAKRVRLAKLEDVECLARPVPTEG